MAKAHASAGEQLYMCAAKRTPFTTARPAEPAGTIVHTPCSAATADARESTHTSETQRAGRAREDDRPMLADWGYQMGSNRPGFPVGFHEWDARGDDERVRRPSIAGELGGVLMQGAG